MPFTKEQNKAIESFGSNVLVSAGAGSGKTQVLTERVAHFIEKGIKLDEFLILTFTKLAASEMRERIRKRLNEKGLKEALDVDFANIQTFDSYAYSLVKQYYFRLGLTKDITIIDGNIIKIYEHKVLNDIFRRKYEELKPIFYDEENKPSFLKMIHTFCFKNDDDIVDFIIDIYEKLKQEIDFDDGINNLLSKYSLEAKEYLLENFTKNILIKGINKTKDLTTRLPAVPIKKGGKNYDEVVYENLSNLFNEAKNVDYEKIVGEILIIKIESAPSGYGKDPDIEKFKKIFNKLKDIAEELPKSKEKFFNIIDGEKEYAIEIAEILKELHKRVVDYKYQNQAFEYNDISRMAIFLLRDNKDILDELKNRYKVIMVDEYQDTSLIQEYFIKLVENNNVYMVGDVKQSIYRFRDARCDIFIEKYNNYKKDLDKIVIDMNTNFRSRSEVLNNINDIFSVLMTSEFGGADYEATHKLQYGLTSYSSNIDPKMNYNLSFLDYSSKDSDQYQEETEARLIAIDIQNKINSGLELAYFDKDRNMKMKKATYGDFAILIDRSVNFDSYKKVFEEYQIPLDIEKEEDINTIDIVIFLRNLIKIIDCLNKQDLSSDDFKKSYLSIARSFVFNISDADTYDLYSKGDFQKDSLVIRLKDLIDKYKELDSYSLLLNIIYDLDVYHKLVYIGDVRNNSLYLDYFLETFKVMSDLNYSLSDFCDYLKDIKDLDLKLTKEKTDSGIDSVRLMTIHKSKGLDFKVLYLAGVHKKFYDKNIQSKFLYSNKYGLIFPKEGEKRNFIKDVFCKEEKDEEMAEKLRLLYVALTRAREKIIVLFKKEEDDKVPDRFDPDGVNCMASFITPFTGNNIFEHYSLDIKENKIFKRIVDSEEKLDIKELTIDNKLLDLTRASHSLGVQSSEESLKLGTHLHFLLEIMNFKNPDYSLIKDEKELDLIKGFIESSLLADIKDANIYKEYEFVDKENKTNGIIDLILEYHDHIDIIDYKTNNIYDPLYINQVQIYCDYIKRITKKETNGYLYSLVKKEIKKVV